jgi:hypothetical protein
MLKADTSYKSQSKQRKYLVFACFAAAACLAVGLLVSGSSETEYHHEAVNTWVNTLVDH